MFEHIQLNRFYTVLYSFHFIPIVVWAALSVYGKSTIHMLSLHWAYWTTSSRSKCVNSAILRSPHNDQAVSKLPFLCLADTHVQPTCNIMHCDYRGNTIVHTHTHTTHTHTHTHTNTHTHTHTQPTSSSPSLPDPPLGPPPPSTAECNGWERQVNSTSYDNNVTTK